MPYIYRITRGQTIRKARVRAVPLAKAPLAEIAAKAPVPVNVNVTSNISATKLADIDREIIGKEGDWGPAQINVKPSYRELQTEATTLGIPAKQKAGALRKAIREAKRSGA